MNYSDSKTILPIRIIPLDGSTIQERARRSESPDSLLDIRHWQIEEFLRQKGLAQNAQRSYRRQLKKFSSWCNKSWLDVTPSDIGKYSRELKQQELKPASINHALNTLRAFYQWLRRSNGYPVNQPLPTDAIGLERVEELLWLIFGWLYSKEVMAWSSGEIFMGSSLFTPLSVDDLTIGTERANVC